MTATDHSRRIHVVADLGRAARRDPMPFVLTYTLTGEEIATAATAELGEALAEALRAQARATKPAVHTHPTTLTAGVKWHQAKLASGLRWSAYCYLCDRSLFDAKDGTPVMVADSRHRQGVCEECKATTKVHVTSKTPRGTTR